MLGKSKLGVLVLVAILLTSLSLAMVAAQYGTQKISTIAIGSDGTFSAQESSVGVSYVITGTPGTNGTLTVNVFSGDPQSSAAIPSGVSLTHFFSITFDISAHDFTSATVTLSYRDSDVQDLKVPYAVYKYDADSNSYVELPSTVDSSAKTLTVTLNSIDDPLLAIGGATAPSGGGGISTVTWVILIVAIIIIVLLAVFTVSILRKPKSAKDFLKKNSPD